MAALKATVFILLSIIAVLTSANPKNEEQLVVRYMDKGNQAIFNSIGQSYPGNLVCSPFSIYTVLAMISQGAASTTKFEIRSQLNILAGDRALKSGYRSLLNKINNADDVTLHVVNKMYADETFSIKPQYKEDMENFFFSQIENVDFNNAEETASTINEWCFDVTNGNIKEIVAADRISPTTRMMILNAVYFKGKWATLFDPKNTVKQVFNLDGNRKITTEFMNKQENMVYGELKTLDAQFVELPYKNKNLSLIIILPDEVEGLSKLEEKIKSIDLLSLVRRQSIKEYVALSLPKFKITNTLRLTQPLYRMSIKNVFTRKADLSHISNEELFVSRMIQKVFIEVNEEGTEAAAVTDAELDNRFGPSSIPFLVDRPFLAILQGYGVELFMSRVVKPEYD